MFLGKDDANIDFDSFERPVHVALVEPLRALKSHAQKAGFSLGLASGYRSYERQLLIWNNKASGRRPVLDSNENPVDIDAISSTELMFLMLRWSALPGASRHHWGTEIDVIDLSRLSEGQSYDLTIEETADGAIFSEMHQWLNEQLQNKNSEFYRPYSKDMGGVSPEPWHLSLFSVAQSFEEFGTKSLIFDCLSEGDFLLKQEVLAHFDEIYERFITNVEKR